MPRVRAFLAVLFALTWCSAAWHAELETLGMMLEHAHHGHVHDDAAQPAGAADEHTEVFARNLAKDPIRVGSLPTVWFGFLGLALWLAVGLASGLRAPTCVRLRRETGPPWARRWHFLQRCAPPSAAPPALG